MIAEVEGMIRQHGSNPPVFFKNTEHAGLAGQLARHFGNHHFELPPIPQEVFIDLAYHHDDGWQAIDDNPPLNDEGLPFDLQETPTRYLFATINESPAINEKRHPLAGLLDSMHLYGIYTGRFGLTDPIDWGHYSIDEQRQLRACLNQELERQNRLKAQLAGTPCVYDHYLMYAYKLLQFLDMLALYFNCRTPGMRGAQIFEHVPCHTDEDVCVTIHELESGAYRLIPFPFHAFPLELSCQGMRMIKARHSKGCQSEIFAEHYTLLA
jgi:hypothetical protein